MGFWNNHTGSKCPKHEAVSALRLCPLWFPELRGRTLLLYLIDFSWRCAMLLKCHTSAPGLSRSSGFIPDRSSCSRDQGTSTALCPVLAVSPQEAQKQEKKPRNKNPESPVQGMQQQTSQLCSVTRRVTPACSTAHRESLHGGTAESKPGCKSEYSSQTHSTAPKSASHLLRNVGLVLL